MEREMKNADLIVCRAYATTIAELTAAAKPSVLIPLPTAADDHQRKNAEVLQRAGAAEVIEQRDLSGAALAERIVGLLGDPGRRQRMAGAWRARSRARTRPASSPIGRWNWRAIERRSSGPAARIEPAVSGSSGGCSAGRAGSTSSGSAASA